ncbi:MAG: 3-deoxy-8-phosphooctulonate synthase [Planctomycetota bacterium]|jgi:2-dehydro-3-deoxyphosphooctonate aldolase (KDO 8-P synthase)
MSLESFKIGIGDSKASMPSLDNLVEVGLDAPLFVIAGPCVIEGEDLCMHIAQDLSQIAKNIDISIIFKASFDKANRSSLKSYRGPGLEKGLEILSEVRRKTKLPILTDVHEPHQASEAAKVVDCLQIPAFLCRQTDLLVACARTNKPVNIKKGQFISPDEMKNAVEKIRASENEKIILTERGTFFGYNRLVNDMAAINAMQKLGCPVVFDATHSTQKPGGLGDVSAGNPDLAPLLAKAAVAAGANGLFFEVHPEPKKAKSDAASILPLDWLEPLLITCKNIFKLVRS